MGDRDSVGPLGAWLDGGGASFRVWAPTHRRLEWVEHDHSGRPFGSLAMAPEPNGYFSLHVEGRGTDLLYKYRVDGDGPFPDPWSRSQPLGVHGPSQVVSAEYPWSDGAWLGITADRLVLYEVHVGTATPEGTFDAFVPRLRPLRELGITALQLMPVASFPGARNWGYDGVALYAPQASYGGPHALRALIDAAHAEGLAVLIDAVYNHVGPDGNYLRAYSPYYFSDRHTTPWGDAVNWDGPESAPVRELVLRNAEMWIRDFHADGLRLDAVHEIVDESQIHLVQQIQERARAAAEGRSVVLLVEDHRNEPRLVTPVARGGWGLDAVWADDLHHQLRRAFAGDRQGYFADYTGSAEDIASTLRKGWFYEGQKSKFTGRRRGKPPGDLPPWRFVHFIQNHDQIGNRPRGDRLGESVSPAAFRAMSTLLLLSPYTPLLFMGQEWNASTPFQFFTDHEPELGKRVTDGRQKEFESFEGFQRDEVPDPQAASTFERSRLDWTERGRSGHSEVLALYAELLRLRATDPRLTDRRRESWGARALGRDAIIIERREVGSALHIVVNIRGTLRHRLEPGAVVILWSEDRRFGGTQAHPPVIGGILELDGPSAAVITVALR
jgi:maltooligosyltrehalose trehalohydrolase